MTHNSSEFSFDVYPGLDRELDDLYRRNMEQGVVTDEAVTTGALAAVAQEAVAQAAPETKLAPDLASWLEAELDDPDNGALNKWRNYSFLQHDDLPSSVSELIQDNPDLITTFEHLFEAKTALDASDETTPEGLKIGDTMHLVLVPWQEMRDHLEDFPEWVKQIRATQGVATNDDFFNDTLLTRVQQEVGGLYRDPKDPKSRLSAKRYLNLRIEQDGPWGALLVQTSDQAGLSGLVQGDASHRTPDALTSSGDDHFQIAGQDVDALGIFEWMALTMQEDPDKISSQDLSWMLANRFDVDGDPHVPCGDWFGSQVKSYLNWAGYGLANVRPRLAVIKP